MITNQKFKKTRWHRLLASILSEWLTPVGITVQAEVPVTTEPQKADILLIKHPKGELTKQQQLRLSDGLRDSKSSHLLLEFKYTESLSENGIIQLLSYGLSYKQSQKLSADDVDLFLLCSKTPQAIKLEKLGFKATDKQGIYNSGQSLVSRVTLILLNELSDTLNNMPLKCFSSKKQEINKAFQSFKNQEINEISLPLERMIIGLWTILLKGEKNMTTQMMDTQEITPEFLIEQGKEWSKLLINTLPVKDRLEGLSIQDKLEGLSIQDKLEGLSIQDKLQGISPEERLAGLSKDELKKLKEKLDRM